MLGVPQEEGQGQTKESPLSEDVLKAAYRSVDCQTIPAMAGVSTWL